MAKQVAEIEGNRVEFDKYDEREIIMVINSFTTGDSMPVIVLEVLRHSDIVFGSVLLGLVKSGWSVEKFQSLINFATQNSEKYPGMNQKIKQQLPFEISTKMSIRDMPKSPQSSSESVNLDGLSELLVGAGVVVGVGAG